MPTPIETAETQIEKMRTVLRDLRDKLLSEGDHEEAAAVDAIMRDDDHVLRLTAIVVPKN